MKIKTNDIIKVFIYLLLIVVVVAGIVFYKSVFWMVVLAVVFSYLLKPAVDFLEKYIMVRWVSILLLYIIIAGILTLAVVSILPVFFDQLQEMGNKVTDIASKIDNLDDFKVTELESVQKLINPVIEFTEKTNIIDLDKIFRDFLLYLQKVITDLPQSLSSIAGKVFNLFTFLVMIPTLSFFFLKDKELFRKFFFSLIPNRYFELTVLITEKTDNVLKTFFRAVMFEMLIVAVMSTIALMSVNVPYSIVVGLLAGIGNVIPYVGPLVGIIAAIISILLSGAPLVKILSAIIVLQIVQFIENRFIYPQVMGKTMEMHPMVVLLTVIAGGYTLGVIGMLFSVPAVYLIKEIYQVLRDNLRKFEIL